MILCANIAVIIGVIFSWVLEGVRPISMVITAFNIANILTFYKEELKELIEKIKGNDDDDFHGGSFG